MSWLRRAKVREECPKCHAMVDPNKRFGLQYHREQHPEDPFDGIPVIASTYLARKTCCGICGTWRNDERDRGLPRHPVQP